jgi:hypothetical protein
VSLGNLQKEVHGDEARLLHQCLEHPPVQLVLLRLHLEQKARAQQWANTDLVLWAAEAGESGKQRRPRPHKVVRRRRLNPLPLQRQQMEPSKMMMDSRLFPRRRVYGALEEVVVRWLYVCTRLFAHCEQFHALL